MNKKQRRKTQHRKAQHRKAGMLSWINNSTRRASPGRKTPRSRRSPQNITLQFVTMGGEITPLPNLPITSTLSDTIIKLEEQTGMIISMVTNEYEPLDPTKTLRQLNLKNNTELAYMVEGPITIKHKITTSLPPSQDWFTVQQSAFAKCRNLGISFYGKTQYTFGLGMGEAVINGYFGFVDNSPAHIIILSEDTLDTPICNNSSIKQFKSTNLFQPDTTEIKIQPRDYYLYTDTPERLEDLLQNTESALPMNVIMELQLRHQSEPDVIYMFCDHKLKNKSHYIDMILQDNEPTPS